MILALAGRRVSITIRLQAESGDSRDMDAPLKVSSAIRMKGTTGNAPLRFRRYPSPMGGVWERVSRRDGY
jgi:hypothetical protein